MLDIAQVNTNKVPDREKEEILRENRFGLKVYVKEVHLNLHFNGGARNRSPFFFFVYIIAPCLYTTHKGLPYTMGD